MTVLVTKLPEFEYDTQLRFRGWLRTVTLNTSRNMHRELTSLTTLYLSGTKISDAGLVHLKGLTSLNSLYLEGTGISDAGLVHLKELTSLRRLYLRETKFTEMGVKELKAAIPKCFIQH